MNWRVESTATEIGKAKPTVEHTENEDDKLTPDATSVRAAKDAAKRIAKNLGGECHVEIHGHETTKGRGFRPAHTMVTVSRLDPKA